ncbi:MAG TPA: hypothetical protein PKE64_30385 [Anaerolineae bacterium]|nr:hypothetical protein [Anaerolineae bacterium]HMR68340.1 hypothetical protein [Anaerolineae bacterium]
MQILALYGQSEFGEDDISLICKGISAGFENTVKKNSSIRTNVIVSDFSSCISSSNPLSQSVQNDTFIREAGIIIEGNEAINQITQHILEMAL